LVALPARSTPVRQVAIVISAALAASAVTALVVWRVAASPPTPLRPVQHFALPTAPGAPYGGPDRGDFAISPDGTRLIYPVDQPNGSRQLFVQPFDQTLPQPLPSTGFAVDPFFSPDGNWIAFFQLGDRLGTRATLNKIGTRGGPAIEICSVNNPFGGVWADDGTIVFATAEVRGPTADANLFRVSANGGAPQRVRIALQGPDQIQLQAWPDVLPGGRGILYSARRELREDSRIVLVTPDNLSPRTIIDRGSHARYVSTGHIV
jgi:hypothetical protein